MKRIDTRDIVTFEKLTDAALNEPDSAACIGHLLKREKISARLAEFSPTLDELLAERLYCNEVQVIDRLERERVKLLFEIDRYSKEQKAIKTYISQFPLPPFPSFFNKKN